MDTNYLKYKKYKTKYLEATKLKMVTPATMFKLFENKNVVLVNTLDNPYVIVKKPIESNLKIYKSFGSET